MYFVGANFELHVDPFKVCVLSNFVDCKLENEFLENVKNELVGLDFNEKNNDLYKFKQVLCMYQYFPILELVVRDL